MGKKDAEGREVNYGLLADAVVKWLLDRENEVRAKIVEWIRSDAGTGMVDVAGPPTAQELIRFRERKDKLNLPTIRLHLERTTERQTETPAVKVTVSDPDREEILRWHRETRMRRAIANGGSFA